MANNGVVVFAPLNTDDLVAVLGHNSHDVATLCGSVQINMFARFKPVRYDKEGELTAAERKSVSYGLVLTHIASATSAAVNLVANLQTSIPPSLAWAYNRVRPGTDWCRMTDFINEASPTGPGYNHSAKAPMSGFQDITLFQSEFGSESKIYSFNFKWGPSSNQGANDTSGIEIPITDLHSTITDGTWRFGLLIYFPSGQKYQVAVASAPSAISDSLTQPGDMMIRPAGTGQLKALFTAAFNAGVTEITAIPFIANGISRGGTGNEDRWMFTAAAKVISMPLGEKIKIKLSSRFSNVSITFHSIEITYLDNAGTSKASYTLTPTDASSGMHKTTLAAPSASGALRCKIVLDFTMSGTMASSDSIARSAIRIGLNGNMIDTAASALERYLNNAWSSLSSITTLGGRYRLTATDAGPASGQSAIMRSIESLPRRSSGSADIQMRPTVSLDGAKFNTGNYFYHHG